ncbi:MAG: hypothetical protein ACK55O_02625 [Phycisphaerales bacterium]
MVRREELAARQSAPRLTNSETRANIAVGLLEEQLARLTHDDKSLIEPRGDAQVLRNLTDVTSRAAGTPLDSNNRSQNPVRGSEVPKRHRRWRDSEDNTVGHALLQTVIVEDDPRFNARALSWRPLGNSRSRRGAWVGPADPGLTEEDRRNEHNQQANDTNSKRLGSHDVFLDSSNTQITNQNRSPEPLGRSQTVGMSHGEE